MSKDLNVCKMRRLSQVAVLAFGILLSLFTEHCCHGQTFQFNSDPNGNLLQQFPASSNPPAILSHPQSQVAKPGELAAFFVVVADTRGLTYQWQTNGVNLFGATNDALLITNVSTLNQGLYSVVLSNSSGSVTSAAAMLWLDADGDELPDSWELTYFGGLGQNPGSDFDGDGISNLDEFNDSTNPTNNASAEFRLTVLNNGGQVTVSPMKLSYTNGEMVTVTATAFPSEVFHGWTGDIVSRSNAVNLVMNGSKTVFAHFQPFLITWITNASGNWTNPANWNPALVPTGFDDVALPNNVTVTVNEAAACHNLTLTAGTLTGSSNLTVYGDFVWTSGTMDGSGRTIIAPGATLTINSPSFTLALNRPLENGGTVVWAGAPGINVNNVVITNCPGALFHVQNAATLGSGGGTPRFDNAGTFRKSANSGTMTFNIPFNNYGDLDLQTGTLHHNASFINNGSVAVAAGATHRMGNSGSGSGTFSASATSLIEWPAGTFTLTAGAQLNGVGTYRLNGATVNFDTDVAMQNLELLSGTFAGSGVVTVSNTMAWSSGTLSGGGQTIIAPGATLTINSPFFTMTLARSL
jgi:hypothetical protein